MIDSPLENAGQSKVPIPESERPTKATQPLSIDAGELPWDYGENRMTALVRDPDSAYLYWEITDEGIADARSRLGPAGDDGWCNLRIYDTTGQPFDGTNANDYFDLRVERTDREQYLMIRRPTSSMHAEIGLKTAEGFFQPIARSGRADFPRSAPSPNATLEWMTITSEGAPPCVAPYKSRYAGPAPPLPGRAGAGYIDAWRAGYAPATKEAELPREASSWSARGTLDRHVHVERWWRLDEWRAEWRSGLRFLRWEHFDPERVAVELLGETPAHVHVEGGELVVYGPWRVTLRGLDAPQGRRVLSTWSMHWVRATTPLIERWERSTGHRVLSERSHVRVFVGASEQYALAEGGASELVSLGGSERLWLGASEGFVGGASELVFLGASGHVAASVGAPAIGASERPAERGRGSFAPEAWGGRLDASERKEP